MKFSELIKNIEYRLIQGDINTDISALTSDSRTITSDSVFVCIRGAQSDGHDYIWAALKKGAKVIVVEGNEAETELDDKYRAAIEEYVDVTVIAVENTRRAFAFMSIEYFGNPAKDLFVIGITGTKGKTTTTYMIRSILESCGIKTGLIGTIEIIAGDEIIKSRNTTPESYQIHESFKKMVDCGCRAVVMEVSSQGLKLDRTAGITFDIGVFTNLSRDHIGPNEHSSFEEYVECKAKLFNQCRIGIVNADDEYTDKIIANCSCDIEKYGIKNPADIRAVNVELSHVLGNAGVSYNCEGLVNMDVLLSMPGEFSVYNSLCAIAVTRHFNVDKEHLRETLRSVKVKGRVEPVYVSEKFAVIIDYAHNPVALESVLKTYKQYEPKRLICLFGCGGNRDRERRFDMGEISGKLADLTIVTINNSRMDNSDEIIADIQTGLERTDGKYLIIRDRKEAIEYAISNAEYGDIIILAAKGHENYQDIMGVRYPFDERQIVADATKNLAL